MKEINFPMLLLAFLVIFMFCLVGIAIYYQNFWLVFLFLFLGFAFMGLGLARKRANMHND